MESTASDDIIGCMFVLVDDVAMAGGGGGGCGILGHFFHFWILILDFGIWVAWGNFFWREARLFMLTRGTDLAGAHDSTLHVATLSPNDCLHVAMIWYLLKEVGGRTCCLLLTWEQDQLPLTLST